MNDLQVIHDYLADSLSPEEKGEVEARMGQDKAFASRVAEQREYQLMLRAAQRAELKASLRDELSGARSSGGIRPLWIWGSLAAAAVVVLLLWVAPWQTPSLSPEMLALERLEPYPLMAERGPEAAELPEVDLEAKAYGFYRDAKYAEALPAFETLTGLFPEEDVYYLYYGECLSQTGQYGQAVEVFRNLSDTSPYRDAAQWRWALNLILGGKTKEAKTILADIASASHFKASEAAALLEQLP